jgi:hypothetical protein
MDLYMLNLIKLNYYNFYIKFKISYNSYNLFIIANIFLLKIRLFL